MSPKGTPCCSIKRKKYVVSRLVAEAFIDNPKGFKYIVHKNGLIRDNRACNLEYSEKAIYPKPELPVAEMIQSLYEQGLGINTISNIFEMTPRMIRDKLLEYGVTLRIPTEETI